MDAEQPVPSTVAQQESAEERPATPLDPLKPPDDGSHSALALAKPPGDEAQGDEQPKDAKQGASAPLETTSTPVLAPAASPAPPPPPPASVAPPPTTLAISPPVSSSSASSLNPHSQVSNAVYRDAYGQQVYLLPNERAPPAWPVHLASQGGAAQLVHGYHPSEHASATSVPMQRAPVPHNLHPALYAHFATQPRHVPTLPGQSEAGNQSTDDRPSSASSSESGEIKEDDEGKTGARMLLEADAATTAAPASAPVQRLDLKHARSPTPPGEPELQRRRLSNHQQQSQHSGAQQQQQQAFAQPQQYYWPHYGYGGPPALAGPSLAEARASFHQPLGNFTNEFNAGPLAPQSRFPPHQAHALQASKEAYHSSDEESQSLDSGSPPQHGPASAAPPPSAQALYVPSSFSPSTSTTTATSTAFGSGGAGSYSSPRQHYHPYDVRTSYSPFSTGASPGTTIATSPSVGFGSRGNAEMVVGVPGFGARESSDASGSRNQAGFDPTAGEQQPHEMQGQTGQDQQQATPEEPKKRGARKMPDNAYAIEPISGLKPFVNKLRWLLKHPDIAGDVVCWSETGDAVLVDASSDFLANEVLPRTFAHSNVSAFTRQFAVYGFIALKDSQLVRALARSSDADWIEANQVEDDTGAEIEDELEPFPTASRKSARLAPNPSASAPVASTSTSTALAAAPRPRDPKHWRAFVHSHTKDEFAAARADEREGERKRREFERFRKQAQQKKGQQKKGKGKKGDFQVENGQATQEEESAESEDEEGGQDEAHELDNANWFTSTTIDNFVLLKRLKPKSTKTKTKSTEGAPPVQQPQTAPAPVPAPAPAAVAGPSGSKAGALVTALTGNQPVTAEMINYQLQFQLQQQLQQQIAHLQRQNQQPSSPFAAAASAAASPEGRAPGMPPLLNDTPAGLRPLAPKLQEPGQGSPSRHSGHVAGLLRPAEDEGGSG